LKPSNVEGGVREHEKAWKSLVSLQAMRHATERDTPCLLQILRATKSETLSEPASHPRFPIHPPRRHPGLKCGLEGQDKLLKLVERQAGEIQELHRAGL
jgi:hypothetical protein